MEESENKQPLNFNINMNNEAKPQQNPSPQNRDSNIDFTNFLQHAANPGVVFFTLLFKTLAIIAFLILGLFGFSDALIFIIVVILNAFDFCGIMLIL